MVSVKSLAAVGHAPSFFRLRAGRMDADPPPEYYIFDNEVPGSVESWDVIGLQWHNGGVLLDVRLMHFDQEMLAWPPFDGERDSPGYVSLNPSELVAIIEFFAALLAPLSGNLPPADGPIEHFRAMGREGLLALHLTSRQVAHGGLDWYEYHPDSSLRRSDERTVLRLPRWSPEHQANQSTMLICATFDRHRLAEPGFNPIDAEGLGIITLNGPALGEFLALLKERVYPGGMRDTLHP